MPTYAYVAMNSSGQEVKEELDADSSEQAIAKIRSKGYFPTKVK
jgi:type IV pilus assembly protein PilC